MALTLVAATPVELTPPPFQRLDSLNLSTPVGSGGILNDRDSLEIVQVWLSSLNERQVVGLITRSWRGVTVSPRFPSDWWPVIQGVRDVNRVAWALDPAWSPLPGSKQLEPVGMIEPPRRVVTFFLPPGFNPEKTRALLYFEQTGITDCCAGWVAFEKKAGKWESAVPNGMELINGSLQ